jgi:hypothetical protein
LAASDKSNDQRRVMQVDTAPLPALPALGISQASSPLTPEVAAKAAALRARVPKLFKD